MSARREMELFFIGVPVLTAAVIAAFFLWAAWRRPRHFAELDAALPEPLRERRPWRMFAAVLTGWSLFVAWLWFVPNPDDLPEPWGRRLALGWYVAGTLAILGYGVRNRVVVRRWRGAGRMRLGAAGNRHEPLEDPRPTLMRLGSCQPGNSNGWWYVAFALCLAPSAIGIVEEFRGEWWVITPVFWIGLGIAADYAARRPEGMPRDGLSAVTDEGLWDGRWFTPWDQLYALYEAPAPDGRRAVAAVTPSGCQKFLLDPNAIGTWDALIAERRPELRRLRDAAAGEGELAGEAGGEV